MRGNTPLTPAIFAKFGKSQPLTPQKVVDATAAMTPEQAAQTRQNIGADTPETVAAWLDEHVDPDTGYVIDNSLTVEGAAADSKATGDAVGELKSAFETYTPHNLYDYTKISHNKYLNPNGVMEDYNGRYVTDYIPAVPGKYIVCSYIASNNTVTRTSYSAICCFDDNKNVVSGGDYNKSSFLVPNGVAFVRITVSGTMNVETAMVENSNDTNPTTFEFFRTPTDFLSRNTVIYPTKMGFMSAKSALSAGERIDLPYHNVKNGNVIAFTSNISFFSSLKIGKSNDAIVTVDSTNIIVHNDQGDFTEAHGLTIENNLQILITNKTSLNAYVIRITSNGISHTVTGVHRFLMDDGTPFVESVDSAFTDAVLSWTSRNINKPIWLFGDSYFSWYPSRWTYYLAEDGFTESCMLNGYAGEPVQNGMLALRSLLNVKTPDYVVWCLGMNNADSETAVSHTWELAYNELVGLANSYGFELILATIPNTPTVNNTFKNNIVKNSGYRYIDFSNAVNIPNSNTWYSGMLANDNVHPTINGAKSLYGQVLADFPEITSL